MKTVTLNTWQSILPDIIFVGGVKRSGKDFACDRLVEEAGFHKVHIVEPWLARRWCRRFVVNLKFGRVDPIALLRELRASSSLLMRQVPAARIVHLYHDREELTVVGELG